MMIQAPWHSYRLYKFGASESLLEGGASESLNSGTMALEITCDAVLYVTNGVVGMAATYEYVGAPAERISVLAPGRREDGSVAKENDKFFRDSTTIVYNGTGYCTVRLFGMDLRSI